MAFFIPSASIMGRNWDMHDWKYFAIPSSNIPKQLNSDDCGVFVAKRAQHISVGLPVDFPHRNMVNFRYSRHSKRKALSMYIPCAQMRKESLKRTTAASSQMSTTSTPHSLYDQSNVSIQQSHPCYLAKEPSLCCQTNSSLQQSQPYYLAKQPSPCCQTNISIQQSQPHYHTTQASLKSQTNISIQQSHRCNLDRFSAV